MSATSLDFMDLNETPSLRLIKTGAVVFISCESMV
jgi:hypothetical protein